MSTAARCSSRHPASRAQCQKLAGHIHTEHHNLVTGDVWTGPGDQPVSVPRATEIPPLPDEVVAILKEARAALKTDPRQVLDFDSGKWVPEHRELMRRIDYTLKTHGAA